jgi:poly(A) polymerase
VERAQDLGGNGGDDRQSFAQAPVELKLDAAKWRRIRGMARLLAALGAKEGLTRYVGGAVRDGLLGLPVNDVDLATRLKPDEVIRRLEKARIKAVPTGIDHGTITAVSDGHPFEITTLRTDVSTDGRRATVAFTDDWKADAARRDFTINALSADPESGEIFDYFGGLDDLGQRHVRFIGDPLQRIAEDYLRILRFFRFHARFGLGEPDPEAIDACAQCANALMSLSRERIADEKTAARHREWPPFDTGQHFAMTFMVWAAARRAGRTALTFDQWQDKLEDWEPVKQEPADPTR